MISGCMNILWENWFKDTIHWKISRKTKAMGKTTKAILPKRVQEGTYFLGSAQENDVKRFAKHEKKWSHEMGLHWNAFVNIWWWRTRQKKNKWKHGRCLPLPGVILSYQEKQKLLNHIQPIIWILKKINYVWKSKYEQNHFSCCFVFAHMWHDLFSVYALTLYRSTWCWKVSNETYTNNLHDF